MEVITVGKQIAYPANTKLKITAMGSNNGGRGSILIFNYVSTGVPLDIDVKKIYGYYAKISAGTEVIAVAGGGGAKGGVVSTESYRGAGGNAGKNLSVTNDLGSIFYGNDGGSGGDTSGGSGGNKAGLTREGRYTPTYGYRGGDGGYGYYNGQGGWSSAPLGGQTGGGGGGASYLVHPISNLISIDWTLSDLSYPSVIIEELNEAPTITLSSPTANQTLYENDTFNITGTASDADNGNTVTIRYQVNAETVRSIKAFVSDGTTVESFAKSLVFKAGKLFDGETAITGNLIDGVAHKLKVWATDDQGGTSTIVERDFYVVPNRAPSLTVDAPVISGNIDSDKFTINGSYNDADGNTTTVKYRINGGNSVQVASGTSGVFDFEVSFAQLTTGPNTIVVEAIDSYGAKTSKTVKLNKNVVSTEQLRSTARYKVIPPTNTAQAVLLWIERDKDLKIDVAISMTMVGEAESFVPVTVSESVPIANGSTTYEDTFFYEADAPKDNIIVQIDMTRQSVDADDSITLISGVLE